MFDSETPLQTRPRQFAPGGVHFRIWADVGKVAPTQRHFKDSSFDFSRQRSLWRGTNNNNKNTRLPWQRNLRTFLKGECHFLDGGGPTPRRMVGRSGNEWMVQEAVLPALARTIAHSQGERGLMVCLAREADFSEMMSLAAHPEAKHGLALRLRTLCRQALPLGSTLHRKLCWQLLVHREQKVRSHILRFVRYDGQSIWRAGRREASEITGESTEKGRDSASGGKFTCDP